MGSALVALIVIAIAGVVIRLNAESTLHASDVSVATLLATDSAQSILARLTDQARRAAS